MAELNIPMRTKTSMDLGTLLVQGGEERILPAMDLRDVQNGIPRSIGAADRKQSSYRQPGVGQAGAMNQGLPPGQGQPEALRSGGSSGQGQSGALRSGGSSGQRQDGRTQGSFPSRQNSYGNAGNSRRETSHYEVRPEGGTVLNKGGKVSFSSLYPGHLSRIEVEMGWDAAGFSADDVDASCFMLGENGKAIGDEWFVFYNQPSSPDNSIIHGGKHGGEKKEKIMVDFPRLGLKVKRLAFVLTINEAKEHGWSFSQVGNAHVRIRDKASGKELALFNLSDYYEGVTAMTVCEFYEYHGEWKINPVGHGLKDTGLLELCRFYGVRVE